VRGVVALFAALNACLRLLFWLVFVQAVLSWIPSLAEASGWVRAFDRAARRVTGPLLQPIRDHLPSGAVIDFSPLVLLVLIQVARWLLGRLLLG
jgi:YggT family protein